jgi:hypothetical protein
MKVKVSRSRTSARQHLLHLVIGVDIRVRFAGVAPQSKGRLMNPRGTLYRVGKLALCANAQRSRDLTRHYFIRTLTCHIELDF